MDVTSIEITPELLRFTPPSFTEEQVGGPLLTHYGLQGHYKPLMGERDQNFRLTTDTGVHYVVKISAAEEDLDVVKMQTAALRHIEEKDPSLPIPRIIRTKDDENHCFILGKSNTSYQMRVLSYVEGEAIGCDYPYPDDVLYEAGVFQARMCLALEGFKNPAAEGFMAWNIANGLALNPNLHSFMTDAQKDIFQGCLHHLSEVTFPALKKLRQQIIHNDAHCWNLLFKSEDDLAISGLIDFGDIVYAPIIDDIAVMAESFIRSSEDIGHAITQITKGFHSQLPLLDEELRILPDLILLRTLLNALLQDYKAQIMTDVDQEYLDLLEGDWKFLQRYLATDRDQIYMTLKENCQS